MSYAFHSDSRSSSSPKKLLKGVKENLGLVRDFYPDFVMRLYLDRARTDDKTLGRLCSLACADNKLDLCDVGQMPGENPVKEEGAAGKLFPLIWGVMAAADAQVRCITILTSPLLLE